MQQKIAEMKSGDEEALLSSLPHAHYHLNGLKNLWVGVLQADCEAHLWEHCPQTVHSFAAFAQQQEDERGVMPNLLKWQSILVRPHTKILFNP